MHLRRFIRFERFFRRNEILWNQARIPANQNRYQFQIFMVHTSSHLSKSFSRAMQITWIWSSWNPECSWFNQHFKVFDKYLNPVAKILANLIHSIAICIVLVRSSCQIYSILLDCGRPWSTWTRKIRRSWWSNANKFSKFSNGEFFSQSMVYNMYVQRPARFSNKMMISVFLCCVFQFRKGVVWF